ncbi:NAD(P)-dependent oxidoreductase [Acanthopleuribacter pedis]|uniref:precorrin-2 dehydrogenase n=1 Tax=Acanthopleuribacter pedis TaxID=442870 RepID=A0A8J7Q4V0_9BACT|nr:bifunctional precorrin-2 dehydrogenase/sirohydrochlorin ferrochelatase [Acanthopleuribacter pedis]
MKPEFYPIFIDLRGRAALVVGAGEVGEQKIEPLLEAGAKVTVIAPWAKPAVAVWAEQGRLTYHARAFEEKDMDAAYFLVIAATDNRAVNKRIFEMAETAQRLVNVVDDPPLCNFIVPAIARSGPIQVAISSSGRSPTMAGQIKRRIQRDLLGEDTGRLASWLGEKREWLKPHLGDFKNKRVFWRAVQDSNIPGLVRSNHLATAEQRLLTLLEANLAAAGLPWPEAVERPKRLVV